MWHMAQDWQLCGEVGLDMFTENVYIVFIASQLMQRGGSPTAKDRILASKMGATAIEALSEGQRNVMIGIKNGELVYVPFKKAIAHSSQMDLKDMDIVKILSI